jgi:hypothetical protein
MAVRRAFQAVEQHDERRIPGWPSTKSTSMKSWPQGVSQRSRRNPTAGFDADGRVDRLQVAAGQPQRRAIAGMP